jgi:hypothetical protein
LFGFLFFEKKKKKKKDMQLYLSSISNNSEFRDFGSEGTLIWKETNLTYSADFPEKTFNLTLDVPETLRNNQTLYLHAYFCRHGGTFDHSDPNYKAEDVIYGSNRKFVFPHFVGRIFVYSHFTFIQII